MIRTYEYTDPNNPSISSGVLFKQTKYGFAYSYGGGSQTLALFAATSLTFLSDFQGYHFGYSRVIERHNGNGSKVESMLDGVTTTTEFTYDVVNYYHLAPIATSMENSNGKTTRTRFKYAHEMADSFPSLAGIYDALISQHVVNVPFETIVEVDDGAGNFTQTDGNRTEFAFYDGSGNPGSGSAGPYPHLFKRYEMTWADDDPTTGSWVTQGAINQYDLIVAQPKQYTALGWQPENYTWEAGTGLLKTRTFHGFTWLYDYHTGTRMIKKTTEVDGQFVEYEYDPLMRLSQSKARGDSVTINYEYIFETPGASTNAIKKEIIFSPVSGSTLTNRTTFQYLDGLGRSIQIVEKMYSPDQKDVVRAVRYDNQGRAIIAYEPFESANATGAFVSAIPGGVDSTLTIYKTSPLNRTKGVKPPSWYTTFTEYGKNTSTVGIPFTSISYAAGELFTQTIIEPDGSEGQSGNRDIIYKDKKGRLVYKERKDGSGIVVSNTHYIYDEKDRVTEIVPPGAFITNEDLIYSYTYSGDDLLLSKKLPGQDSTVSYLYDSRDLLTFMQDGNMKTAGRWLHTHFDPYGRAASTGFYDGTVTVGTMNKNFDEQLSTNLYGDSGILNGKLITTKRTILGTADTIVMAHQYDQHGRIIQTTGNNHLHAASDGEQVFFEYDFADNIISEKRTHKAY